MIMQVCVPGRVHRRANKVLTFTGFHKMAFETARKQFQNSQRKLLQTKLHTPRLMILQIRSMDQFRTIQLQEADRISMQRLYLPCVSPVLVTVPGEISKDSSFWPLMSGPASSCDGCVKTFTNSFLLPCKTSKKCIFFLTFSCVQEALFSRVAHVGQHWLSLCQFNL